MQKKDGFCFCIQSISLCLFIDELSPFTLRNINDQWLLSPVNLVLVGDVNLCICVFFGICCNEIINCLCFSLCSHLPWVGVFLLVFLCRAGFVARY